jgi:hypothetical protein
MADSKARVETLKGMRLAQVQHMSRWLIGYQRRYFQYKSEHLTSAEFL